MSATGSRGPPTETPKPKLKINVSRSSSFVGDAASSATPAVPASATPSEGARKVKLKLTSSQPPAPAVEKAPAKTKAGRQTKPSQKLVESRKRPHDDDDDDDLALSQTVGGSHSHGASSSASAAAAAAAAAATKIKIRAGLKSAGMQVVLKPRGRPPHHPPGDGYDSEASDREIDPAIEEQFVLRMLPGEHCDYVRWCMENGKMGIPRAQGGADITMKFFDEESRRAVMTVKGQPFAAVMVDLPTITESMKTWDRKSFMKSADICQMLLVFQQVKTEDEAKRAPLPPMIDSHFRWPHGVTPPMHDCVNRRFAKTISRKEIEDKEAEVERLLMEDAKASSTRWEWVDDRAVDEEDEMGADEDAEGEMDDSMSYFDTSMNAPAAGTATVQQARAASDGGMFGDDDDLEADLEAAFADDLMAETPATGMGMTTPLTTQVDTPAPVLQESIENDESDEDEEEDDDDDDDDEDLDEDERAQRDEEQGVKDIIHDMEKQLARRVTDLEKTQNKILKSRLENQIKQLKSEIELKKGSIGIEVD